MFKENIEVIKNSFLEYQGSGMYIALFLIAMLYIYLKEKDKKMRCIFLYFPIVVYAIILNPIFNKIVGKIFTGSVYWRMYWILPIGITLAYTIMKFVMEQKEKAQKIVVAISLVTILIVSGKFVYGYGNFEKVGNLYKLPDDAVLVAQLIEVDDTEYKKALVPENLTPYIRQVTSKVELAYRRKPEGYTNDPLIIALHSGNVKYIAEYAKNTNSNYVVYNKATVLTEPMENYGFEKYNESVFFAIYKYVGE